MKDENKVQGEVANNSRAIVLDSISWMFGMVVFTTGILNMFLVHPVPGVAYLLLSFVYFPPVNAYLKKKLGFSIPLILKIILAIVLIMFTLGVSDLGDMIDKL